MAYVDYTYYKDTFKGSSIPEAAFDSLEVKSEAFVSMITFGRIDEESVPDEAKEAICAVAEKMKQLESAGGIKTSESVGNYSVSWKHSDDETETKLLRSVARLYLSNTGLLYRGR